MYQQCIKDLTADIPIFLNKKYRTELSYYHVSTHHSLMLNMA